MYTAPTTQWVRLALIAFWLLPTARVLAAPPDRPAFDKTVKPILAEYCFGCHADGEEEGSISFDELLQLDDHEAANEKWHRVLRQLQSGLMPPPGEDRPGDDQISTINNWIKYRAFGLNPQQPDPGRVTVRRLNQVEYRNTVRDLIGVDYDTSSNFPADDTGHGFDNIGDVLSLSPLLLEKYVDAAKAVVMSAVPTVSGIMREQQVAGDQFKLDVKSALSAANDAGSQRRPPAPPEGTSEFLYYDKATAHATLKVPHDGEYVLRLNINASETYVDNQFDENRCEFAFGIDDEVLFERAIARQNGVDYSYDFERTLSAGEHKLFASINPLTDKPRIRNLRIQIKSVVLIGPKDEQYFDKPAGHERFFPRDVPKTKAAKREYADELLSSFASRAFRRPVDQATVDRLTDLAESIYGNGETFEAGIAKSMTAILASPRFLFREEKTTDDGGQYPLLDEHSLASRLSYFLWSSMPDEELMRLATAGKLRDNLDQQVARMLQDKKSSALAENFVGQWLRARAIDTIQINSAAVLSREPRITDPEADIRRTRFFELFRKSDRRTPDEEVEYEKELAAFRGSFRGGAKFELTGALRLAMRRESELLFDHIIKDNRSLLELIDSDYTFLNERLWAHYQIEGVAPIKGEEMRLVNLPANSVRGGVLTQGTVLAVTSNPDRTSPVKRGLFVLENLLGTPPAAPPPNIPALEDVEPEEGKQLSLRKTLAIHRENELCSSCHNRMDPLGLALENFNALGRYRKVDLDQPIDAAGVLATGESFDSIRELKKILATERTSDLYRCVTEKLMTYALGRAVEYTDAHTVDSIVEQLEANGGKASTLLYGIIHSNAFQRTRKPNPKGA